MYSLVWKSSVSFNGCKLYWYYDLDTKEFKVSTKYVKLYYKNQPDMEYKDIFKAKFSLTSIPLFTYRSKLVIGHRVQVFDGVDLLVGCINNEIYKFALSVDLNISSIKYIGSTDKKFMPEGFRRVFKTNYLVTDASLLSIKLALEDIRFREEIVKYLVLSANFKVGGISEFKVYDDI